VGLSEILITNEYKNETNHLIHHYHHNQQQQQLKGSTFWPTLFWRARVRPSLQQSVSRWPKRFI